MNRNPAVADPAARAAAQPEPQTALERVAALAEQVGDVAVAAEAEALGARLEEGRFFVACVGQFKRGKSTLINALLGEEILPVGVVPVTSAVTIVRHGRERRARVVRAKGGSEDIPIARLSLYVSEQHNPENTKEVVAVEAFLPCPLLESGMCLVDTPGLGSVFEGNSAVTRRFVPHIDAVLAVLGADPPISADELALLDQISQQTTVLLVVINKADRLDAAELDEARDFVVQVLSKRLGRHSMRIFEVSAAERLREGKATRDWQQLHDELAALPERAGKHALRGAEERGLRRFCDELLFNLGEQEGALSRPAEESSRRLEHLRACIAEADRALADLAPLFRAEQERMIATLRVQREQFLEAVRREAAAELAAELAAANLSRAAIRRHAMDLAGTIAHSKLAAWCREIEPRADELYANVMRRFVDLTSELLGRLRSSGEPILAALPPELVADIGLTARPRFFFHEMLARAASGPADWLASRVLSRRAAIAAATRDAGEYLDRLLDTNTARLTNDLAERVVESRRKLESEIRRQLRGLVSNAENAIRRAEQTRAAGEDSIRHELSRIAALRARVMSLRPAGAPQVARS
jgi:ribosome biogenesis GTPase A